MRIYEAINDDDFVLSLLQMLEQDTGKTIFTMRIMEHTDEGLKALIAFDDKSMMMGKIKVITLKGKMAITVKGNFI